MCRVYVYAYVYVYVYVHVHLQVHVNWHVRLDGDVNACVYGRVCVYAHP